MDIQHGGLTCMLITLLFDVWEYLLMFTRVSGCMCVVEWQCNP